MTLKEAEARSLSIFPYWDLPVVGPFMPRQREVAEALVQINATLDELIERCMVRGLLRRLNGAW